MGFSLKRALAGAIAGAGTAVSEIADLQLKEAAAARLREQEIADKRMLMGEENELLIQREQRAAEMKNKLLNDEHSSIGKMVVEFKAGYKGDITSPEGQRYLAGKFAESGRTDLANLYEDNARAAEQTRNSHLDRQAQLKISAQNSRDNRDATRQRREELQAAKDQARLDKKNSNLFNQVKSMSDRIGTRDRDGKFVRDDNALGIGNTIANYALENFGETHTRAGELAQDAMAEYSRALEANKKLPRDKQVDSRTIADALLAQFIDTRTSQFNTRRTAEFNKAGHIMKPLSDEQFSNINDAGSQPFSLNRSLLNP